MATDSAHMQVMLNGHPHTVATGSCVADLLALLGMQGKRVAVELNGDIVARARFVDTILSPMDRVEIVHAIGGG